MPGDDLIAQLFSAVFSKAEVPPDSDNQPITLVAAPGDSLAFAERVTASLLSGPFSYGASSYNQAQYS